MRSRKAVTRIYTTKAHLNSVQMQMKNQLATLRVAGSLQKSTEVMQAMQRMVNIPEIAGVMRDMSKEMMRAGIIEEMLEETMESMDDVEELEEEAQTEVDKVSEQQKDLCVSIWLMSHSVLSSAVYKGSVGVDPGQTWRSPSATDRHRSIGAGRTRGRSSRHDRGRRGRGGSYRNAIAAASSALLRSRNLCAACKSSRNWISI